MARLQLEGTIEFIGSIIEVGDKNTKKQTLMLLVPAEVDGFTGKERGKAEYWQIDAIGDDVERLALNDDMQGKKAIVKMYLNSNTVEDKKNAGQFIYIIGARLANVELQSK